MKTIFFGVGLGVLGLGAFCANQASHVTSNNASKMNRSGPHPISLQPKIPQISQESINKAILAFHIDVPAYVNQPILDHTLEDRGITTGAVLGRMREVKIGPAAFSSWAVLGSTLAHEIEVHAKQSFIKITAQDEWSSAKSGVLQMLHSLKPKSFLGKASAPSGLPRGPIDWGTHLAEREAYQYELDSAKRFGLSPTEVESIKSIMEMYYSY
jgi:hypothetical protein